MLLHVNLLIHICLIENVEQVKVSLYRDRCKRSVLEEALFPEQALIVVAKQETIIVHHLWQSVADR